MNSCVLLTWWSEPPLHTTGAAALVATANCASAAWPVSTKVASGGLGHTRFFCSTARMSSSRRRGVRVHSSSGVPTLGSVVAWRGRGRKLARALLQGRCAPATRLSWRGAAAQAGGGWWAAAHPLPRLVGHGDGVPDVQLGRVGVRHNDVWVLLELPDFIDLCGDGGAGSPGEGTAAAAAAQPRRRRHQRALREGCELLPGRLARAAALPACCCGGGTAHATHLPRVHECFADLEPGGALQACPGGQVLCGSHPGLQARARGGGGRVSLLPFVGWIRP